MKLDDLVSLEDSIINKTFLFLIRFLDFDNLPHLQNESLLCLINIGSSKNSCVKSMMKTNLAQQLVRLLKVFYKFIYSMYVYLVRV
jgi:hypothetical protein